MDPDVAISQSEAASSSENRLSPITSEVTLLNHSEIELFHGGKSFRAYEKFGAHPHTVNGLSGTCFTVWAPNAQGVQVIGDFNGWDKGSHPLQNWNNSGIWTGFAPGIGKGAHYKFHIASRHRGYSMDKTDPFAFWNEIAPDNASIVWNLDHEWADQEWMRDRHRRNALNAPISIYEMHLGSWMRVPEESHRWLTYRELAPKLAPYINEMGFTHVELLPVMEHPFYGSWGYQTTGYFSPTSRFGSPQDFMFFVDYLHRHGIGVLLDWVPSHFPADGHGLAYFDGTHLFEHADPRQGYHPDWHSAIFNYGRSEVRSFLLSSALFWLDKYHIDGLRVDAVASMLYLDYSRRHGGWIPNRHGGRENLEAIDFLRELNTVVYGHYPDVMTIAEESTSWPKVSRPVQEGGLGFGLKWDMGWMHDTLRYFKRDPIHRKHHHGELAFRLVYAFRENFVLPLSHDEVVHGKGSLFGMMTGDEWQKYANLRLLYGYMFAQPGKKLLFMGSEFAQWPEWKHDSSIEWHALGDRFHAGVQKWLKDLHQVYRAEPACYEIDFHPDGFEWVDYSDAKHSTLSFLRKGKSNDSFILAVFNLTPMPRTNYRIGVPRAGFWKEILNSDAGVYGGGGLGNLGGVPAENFRWHYRPWSVRLTLPPLSALFFASGSSYPAGEKGQP